MIGVEPAPKGLLQTGGFEQVRMVNPRSILLATVVQGYMRENDRLNVYKGMRKAPLPSAKLIEFPNAPGEIRG